MHCSTVHVQSIFLIAELMIMNTIKALENSTASMDFPSVVRFMRDYRTVAIQCTTVTP